MSDTGSSSIDNQTHLQSKRLIQVFYAAEIAIVAGCIQRFLIGDVVLGLIVLALGCLLMSVYILAKKGKPNMGGNLFSIILILGFLYLMWIGEGARDEVLLAFPAIFTLSIFTGSIRVLVSMLALVVVNVLVLGYVNQYGLYININNGNSLSASVLIAILLLLTSFSTWLIARDLRTAIKQVGKENERVRQSQQEIEKLVNYDALTGLPNRILAKLRFEYALEVAHRESSQLCLMFIDLDDFKNINDTLGHKAGDEYLIELSKRLSIIGRKVDVVSRLGGDEFLMILPGIHDKNEAHKIARKILNKVKEPVTVTGDDITSTCSIGMAFSPDNGSDFDELCQKADMAMYDSKDKGKNAYGVFTDRLQATQSRAVALTADLRMALQYNQLQVYLQPQVDLSNLNIVGAEALLRWKHPTKGQISPVEFIPLAERSGQIIEIGDWVIDQVCAQLDRWKNTPMANLRVAINVSPIQFKRATLSKYLKYKLQQYDLRGNSIELEFTESLLMDNTPVIVTELDELKALGMYLSIDDFGTGYSSLGYLKHFDIESLKIDRSFIQHMGSEPKDKAIVEAIVQMAASLDMLTVAEGIEDQHACEILQKMGCKMAQGYYWSKPVPVEQFEQFYLHHSQQI